MASAAVVDTLIEHDRMVDVCEVTGSIDVVAIGRFIDTDEMHDRLGHLLARTGSEAGTIDHPRDHPRTRTDLDSGRRHSV